MKIVALVEAFLTDWCLWRCYHAMAIGHSRITSFF